MEFRQMRRFKRLGMQELLVSDNVKHLERIPKIVLDNWVVRDSHL